MLLMSHLIEKGISTNIFVFYSCLITWYFSFESNKVCLYETSWRIKHVIVLDPDMFLFNGIESVESAFIFYYGTV